jgi:23S rRNA (uracil1939-C5)-methyltransferase
VTREPPFSSTTPGAAPELQARESPGVRIERLANGGDGVGRLPDGRVVFVPRTAPGDLVELSQLRPHSRFARARAGRLLASGPGRVEPRCAHYSGDECGGCQLQHLAPDAQLQAKRSIVQDALTRIGRLDLTVPPLVPADPAWAYRHRITLAIAPGRRHAGYHRMDQPGRVFSLLRCEIAAPALQQLWERLRPHLHLLPADAEHLVLRIDRVGGLHLVVRSGGEQAWSEAARLAARLGVGATVWWQPARGAPRVVAGEGEAFPATVFEQVHPGMGDRIRAFALEQLGAVEGRHVWDLYAGVGDTTDLLLARGATVESVELDRRAVELGERRWRSRHQAGDSQRPPPGAGVRHAGRVEDLIGSLTAPDLVIANPPRTGMDRAATDTLRIRHPGRIVYLSCDPATLARDLARLGAGAESSEPGYRVVTVQPFDLFPQTAHVETVVALEARS